MSSACERKIEQSLCWVIAGTDSGKPHDVEWMPNDGSTASLQLPVPIALETRAKSGHFHFMEDRVRYGAGRAFDGSENGLRRPAL